MEAFTPTQKMRLGPPADSARLTGLWVSEAMPWLGAKVHGQVVLQGHVHVAKVIVDTHVGQRGDIGSGHRTHVDGEVVEHGPHRWQGEGWVNKGIGRHLRMQVLWDRPRQGFHTLHLLSWLLQWGPDAFEGVLSILSLLFLLGLLLDFLNQLFIIFSGVGPQGAPGTFLARGSWRARMLAEMVIAIDRNSTEVAHLGTTAARHAVAAFRLDEASSTLVTFSNPSSSHFFFNGCPVLDVILFCQLFTGEAVVFFPESLTLPTGLLSAAWVGAAEPLHIAVQQSREAAGGAPGATGKRHHSRCLKVGLLGLCYQDGGLSMADSALYSLIITTA